MHCLLVKSKTLWVFACTGTVCHGGRTRDAVYVAIVAGGWPQRPRVACGAASTVFSSCEQVMKRVDSCEAGRYT